MSDTKSVTKKEVKQFNSDKDINALKLKLQKLILEVKSGKEKNTSLIRKSKKEIARILTNTNSTNGI